jgi:sigma-E factor negative regulatory protein RseC
MYVREVKDGKVVVAKARTSACGSCPAKNICLSNNEIKLEIDWNGEDLKPGDEVVVDIPEYDPLKVSTLVYFLPLVIFAVTVITGYLFRLKDWVTFVLALGSVFAYYSLFRFRRKDRKPPRILRKVS